MTGVAGVTGVTGNLKLKTDMKGYFKIVVLLLAAVVALPAASAPKAKTEVRFEKKVHDFGTVKEDGGPVECEFEFLNAGEGNLVVIDATADCGCTKPSYPKNPIAPGKTGKITVKYNPYGRPGAFDKTVTVKTNGKPGKVHLKIRGSVMPRTAK